MAGRDRKRDRCAMTNHWPGPAKSGNISASISDIRPHQRHLLLNFMPAKRITTGMKQLIFSAAALLALTSAAQADCFVEYKAKQDAPLRLHYGILALPGGCPAMPDEATAARLASAGWTLLTVVSSSETSPTAQQKANAGDFFLRF